MTSVMHKIRKMESLNIIKPPRFVIGGCQYLTIMGSVAYGCNEKDKSDLDIYGFTIPSKNIVFPHLSGDIHGFGRRKEYFQQYQQHHVKYENNEYDFDIYNIVKYFTLCMENNPNMIDSLFTPEFCVLFKTDIGSLIRDNRKLFLHKGSFHKFRGYAFSQLKKARDKKPIGKRAGIVKSYGVDVKFLYHVCRLADEAEQVLMFGDIDLQRNKKMLKAIRRGDMTCEEVEKWFYEKEKKLENLYHDSNAVPYTPYESKIKQLLINCLEQHFGSISNCVVVTDRAVDALRKIQEVLETNKALF